MLELRYSLSNEDFINYVLFVQWEAPGKKKAFFRRFGFILIIVSVIFGVNIFNSINAGTQDLSSGFLLGFLILFIVFTYFSTPARLKKQATAFTNNPDNEGMFLMTTFNFSETGVLIKDDVKETRLNWRAFIKKQENEKYYYLYVNSLSAYIIPKKVLKSSVQKEELESLFAKYLSFNAEVGHLVKQ